LAKAIKLIITMRTGVINEELHHAGTSLQIVSPARKEDGTQDFLLSYLKDNKGMITDLLSDTGAMLFRGFGITDKDGLSEVKEIFAGGTAFNYVDGNSPRTRLSNAVYTSTEYPKEYPISLHSELSYSHRWPGMIFFLCHTPAETGGETPIADCRSVLKGLRREIVDKFETLGVKYTRYLSGERGMGKSWMDTFETNDRAMVEGYCRDSQIEFSWEQSALYLSQRGPGVARHPVTGEKVWFNQANQFHPSGLPAEIYKGLKLMHARSVRKFPQYAFFGNGEEIPEEYLKEITDTHFEMALKFKWEKGDLLMLDNMLVAHGRMPFKGDRKIFVSMC